MKRVFITHITVDYLEVAINLAKSIKLFSNIPLIVYCINISNEEIIKLLKFNNVYVRNINLDIDDKNITDYNIIESGNFYVNRNSERIYKILCAKTIAMEMAIEEGWDEICYLDSDCLATPLINDLFNWMPLVSDYPIGTQGIHGYMMYVDENGEHGNPFHNGTWPTPDNKLALEWPLMQFLQLKETDRGVYRTTGIMLMNRNCLGFIKTWKELCYVLVKLVDTFHYAPYHEETIYNVLSWKKSNIGFPLCYVNICDGLDTVKKIYTNSKEGDYTWSEKDTSKRFYKIPEDKKHIKVLHGEKRNEEVDKILDYLKQI